MPPELLLKEHLAAYVDSGSESADDAPSPAHSAETDDDGVVHPAAPSPARSADSAHSGDDVPVEDMLELDEADDVMYDIHKVRVSTNLRIDRPSLPRKHSTNNAKVPRVTCSSENLKLHMPNAPLSATTGLCSLVLCQGACIPLEVDTTRTVSLIRHELVWAEHVVY
jgi:hypothetical protein